MCRHCGQLKPLDDFPKRASSPDGHRTECRACRKEYSRAQYLASREERKEAARIYYAEHQDEQKAAQLRYREVNKHRLSEYQATYRAAHREALNEDNRKRYALHAEERRAYRKRYRRANPDKIRAANNKRKALQRNAPKCDLTAAQWVAIKEAYGHRCVYCGRKMNRLTMDHIEPLSKGGAHTASNIVPACMACNNKKKANPAPPFQQTLLFIAPEE